MEMSSSPSVGGPLRARARGAGPESGGPSTVDLLATGERDPAQETDAVLASLQLGLDSLVRNRRVRLPALGD